MKTKHLLQKTFLLAVALLGGVTSAWADVTPQPIPQEMGSYIVIGTNTGAEGFASYVTKTNCQVDSHLGDAGNYYTVGSTKSDSKVNISVTASEAGNYVFGFKSGASGCASVVTVKMTKYGSDTPMFTSGDITITDDGNWDPNIEHNLYIPDVEAANYTLTLEVKSITTGSYAGNFGNFFFHKTDQLAWSTSSSYMQLADGTYKNARYNSDNVINYISRTGGYIDDLLIYNSTAGYRIFHFNIDSHKQASKVTITVTDFATGKQEAQETKVVTGNGDYLQPLTTEISAGLKKVRFDFADNDETADNDYLFNFRQVYFTSSADYEALPLTGTATLNLNQTGHIFNNCRYEDGDSNIGYVKNGSYADNYIIYNSNESAYYTLNAGIPWYSKGGTFTITITDVATGIEEATATSSEITGIGYVEFAISNAISRGLKKIRFDFAKADESDYLFNLNNVSFSPTAVPVTITSAGMATYVNSDYNLDFSETSIKAYKVKVEEKGVAKLTQVNNVPANTPVLLIKDGGATVNIPIMTGAAAVTENDLVAGTGAAVATTDGDYTNMILNEIDSKVGFYFANGQTVAANRAYLHIATTLAPDAVSKARGMILEFADEKITGINEAAAATEAAQKEGKFVVDGKLVIFKKGMKFNANGARIY